MTDKHVAPVNDIDRYAVLGNPIAHSKSPLIHAEFAKQTKQNMTYEAILVPLDGFKDTLSRLVAEGYKGVNVTVPFKLEARACVAPIRLHGELSEQPVNTISITQDAEVARDTIFGANTDGIGLLRDITQNLGVNLAGKRILLLGAGGAAQGVLYPLLSKAPACLVVANRSIEKANDLVEQIKKVRRYEKAPKSLLKLLVSGVKSTALYKSIELAACTYEQLSNQQGFDIIVNATSAGLTDTALPLPNHIFAPNCLAYDMVYGRETPFMAQARAAGAQVADGLGMLVEQAAEAFYIWRGVRPQTSPVIAMIRAL
ncbi:MAG: shikimate dehydrogenase [Methylophilaceae bacterium]